MQSASESVYQAQDLWHHIFGEERGLLHLWTGIRDSGRLADPKSSNFRYPESADAAAQWALEKSEEGREVYFCAHLLTGPERRRESAGSVHALWFEKDGGKVPNGQLRASAVVESSPGRYHGYLRLTDPIPPATAEALNKRLAHATEADPSGADLTQLLRVPGTVNHKYPDRPVVKVIGVKDSRAYTPAELEEMLPDLAPGEKRSAPEVESRIPSGRRNKELTSIGGTLRRRGLEEPEISATLLTVNARRCDPPLEEDEVLRIASSVARYEPEKVIPIKASGNGHSRYSQTHSLYTYGNVSNEGVIHPKKHLRAVSFARREKPPAQRFVVEGLLPEGLPATLYGTGGLAKSANVLHLGMSVAYTGVEEWHGLEIGTCPVLYLDFEMGEATQLRRAKEIADGAGWPDVPANFRYIEAVGFTASEVFAFAIEQLHELGPSLVIVDSYGFALQGEAERSGDVLGFHRQFIEPLQDAGGTPLTVDHVARVIKGERAEDKDPFGSAFKSYASRSVIHVTGHTGDAGEVFTTFTHKKCNVGPQHPAFTIVTRFKADSITFERSSEVVRPPVAPTMEHKVVKALDKEDMTASEIAAKIEENITSVRNAITRLKGEGVVEPTAEKRAREAVLTLHYSRSRTYRGNEFVSNDDEDDEVVV
jgi:hypothetical protein